MDNKSLLQKADLALSDLSSNGGLLSPEQSNTFIRKLILAPTMIPLVRRVTMAAATRKINKIGFGSRIMRKATSGTALTQNQRSKPTTEQITLTAQEVIAEVRLPYDVLEDNIESASAANNEASNTGPGGLRQTIIELMAERAASDIEELALLAYTTYTSGDADDQAYLSMFNGWLNLASTSGNTLNLGGAGITKTAFKKAMQALPKQYLRNRGAMRHFVSVDQEIEYRDKVADRATALGDATINSVNPQTPYGSPVVPVNHMPSDQGLFTDPQNLIFGVHRDISFEYDKDITTRTYIMVVTMRLAVAIEEPAAVVYFSGIGAVE
jgi:hypothetical protein